MTIRIPFPIDPEIVAFVRTTVATAIATWGAHGLAIAPDIPLEDTESRSLWLDELGDDLRKDAAQLLSALGAQGLGSGFLEMELETAEAITRACSAIRLHLRHTALKRISDDSLEHGVIDPTSLIPGEHASCFTYIFLAELQGILISVMDPGSDEVPDDL
ncbi:MAG: hypothetical protein SFY80_13355 [Verrucomicrobiota bacterium]|nr:hypothetical protein [Verrucomicrobiota bacterium]